MNPFLESPRVTSGGVKTLRVQTYGAALLCETSLLRTFPEKELKLESDREAGREKQSGLLCRNGLNEELFQPVTLFGSIAASWCQGSSGVAKGGAYAA